MTKETYEAAVAALRASPFAAAGAVEEADYSVRDANGSARAYRRVGLRVGVTTGAEAAAVAASLTALAMSVGAGAALWLYVHAADHGELVIAISRDLDPGEAARLADASVVERPSERIARADVPA